MDGVILLLIFFTEANKGILGTKLHIKSMKKIRCKQLYDLESVLKILYDFTI